MTRTSVECSSLFDCSPEDVGRILLDPGKAPLWNTGLERFEVLTKAPGLVGSRARLHFAHGSRRYVMEDELLEVTPNRRFFSRVSGDALEAEVETLLTPTAEGTAVTIRWSGRGRKLVPRLALPLMRRALVRQIRADLKALRALAEAG